MTEIVHKEYLEMCRGKSSLLSKAIASGTECLRCKAVANETDKDKLSPAFKCLKEIWDTKIENRAEMGCQDGKLDCAEWVEAFQTYMAETKYGVLILANTLKNSQYCAISHPWLKEV